jgi:hypothetical protein
VLATNFSPIKREEEQQGPAWPVVHHDVLRLPAGDAGNQDHNAGGLSGVVLEKPLSP